MGLEKSILHGKEHRRPYYRAKRVDSTCRNHGSCPFCSKGRTRWKHVLKIDERMRKKEE